MGRLDGKVAIVTGAARGIGAAAAQLFAREGARLMLADRLHEPLQALTQQLGDVAALGVMDVADEAAVRGLVDATLDRYGQIDIAILNAGIAGELKPITECSSETFDRIMAVNVRSVWLGLKYVMQAMEKRGGSIVITASTSGIRATPNMSAYTASKHAVIGLMRSAALEGASRKIRVNTVNPATIDTPMVQELDKERNKGAGSGERALAPTIPLNRYGTPDEVAHLMLYLASDDASFCTGGVYMIDGGVSAGRI